MDATIRWNGEAVERGEFAELLYITTRLPTEPQPRRRPTAGASYARTAHILGTIKASGVTNVGFVGSEQFRNFER